MAAAAAEQERLHNYPRIVLKIRPPPTDVVQDQVAGPSPMDQVLWFEDNDIFVQGILPFLNLTDLGPFARTCRRAYTAVTGADGKSKGTSCLLKLGLRRRGTSRPNRHRYLEHQHPHADPDDSEWSSLEVVSEPSDMEIEHMQHRRHDRNRNEPELHWEVKKYPSSAMVKPHCVRRVCVAVEHEEKHRKHVPDTVLEIPAALAETKTVDRLLAPNTAGTASAPHSRCRWKKLHRLTVNGPLEIIRTEDPDGGKDMLFFKLLSCGGEDGEEAGTGQQLKELEVDLRWITRSNTLRLVSRTDELNASRNRAALEIEYEDARMRAAKLAAQETFARVFSHLERLTLQCGGRSLSYLNIMPASQQEVERAPSRRSKDNEPKEQFAAPSPIDRVLWFEGNDIFVEGILPFLNLRDLGPFARTCKRAYAAVTGPDGKSKGTSCLLTLVPRRQLHDIIGFELKLYDPLDGLGSFSWNWDFKGLPRATVVKPHGISRVSIAVEHEANKTRTDIDEGDWWRTRTAGSGHDEVQAAPPRNSAAYQTLVQFDILPLLHENTNELRFSYLSCAFGPEERGDVGMHDNLARCLCSADALRVLEIPATLAKSKALEKIFGVPRAGRWIKLRRLIINGPLEVIDRNHMGTLFFKLLSPREDAQVEEPAQLRELEMNLRWAEDVFSRVFPRLEKLTLQCAGRDLFQQDWFAELLSSQMQSLRLLSLGLPRRYSPELAPDAHGPRRSRSGGWGHVVRFLSAHLPPGVRRLELKNMDWSDLDVTAVLLPFFRSLKVKVLRLEDMSFSATQSGALLGFLEFAPDLSLTRQCRARLLGQVRAAIAEAGAGAVKTRIKACDEEE
eukprot:g1587.t1